MALLEYTALVSWLAILTEDHPQSPSTCQIVLGGEHIVFDVNLSGYCHCRLQQGGSANTGALRVLGLNNCSCEDYIYTNFNKQVFYKTNFGTQHPIKDVYYVVPQSANYIDVYFHHNSQRLTVYAIGVAEYVDAVADLPSGAVAATEVS